MHIGPAADTKEVEAVVCRAQEKGYKVNESPSMEYVAKSIHEGKIVGRCIGKSDFGARALGNRSILADPRRFQSVKIINEKVKSRDFWMPFTPSIAEEYSGRYLLNEKGFRAPFMTVAFHTTLIAQEEICAALHQYDLTA